MNEIIRDVKNVNADRMGNSFNLGTLITENEDDLQSLTFRFIKTVEKFKMLLLTKPNPLQYRNAPYDANIPLEQLINEIQLLWLNIKRQKYT